MILTNLLTFLNIKPKPDSLVSPSDVIVLLMSQDSENNIVSK